MSSAFNWVLDVHRCQYDVYLYSNSASFTGPVYMSKAASPVSRAGLSHINRPSVVANFQDLLYTLFTIHFCPSTRNSFWDYEIKVLAAKTVSSLIVCTPLSVTVSSGTWIIWNHACLFRTDFTFSIDASPVSLWLTRNFLVCADLILQYLLPS